MLRLSSDFLTVAIDLVVYCLSFCLVYFSGLFENEGNALCRGFLFAFEVIIRVGIKKLKRSASTLAALASCECNSSKAALRSRPLAVRTQASLASHSLKFAFALKLLHLVQK